MTYWNLTVASDYRIAALTYLQGYRARSWIEYSLMKKYVGIFPLIPDP